MFLKHLSNNAETNRLKLRGCQSSSCSRERKNCAYKIELVKRTMSSPITPACAVGEESWEEGREKMTGDFAPSKNSWNHDIWRLMLACFFYDTFIFCSFPYKPSFFCPPCWQLRRSAHLHFYLSACCSMFRTPSSLALLLFPIKKKSIASDFTTLDEGET